ncbi:BglG family transcription antiterminator [Paraliobacillus salinarum]|uniref:BglG family transcription antiterminator n=1 Tax=Paraliobacillus salinarum TaxID=1158996 RepID=UPI0015F371E9|nr:BglG family transcription antiterminator [Paraliobacillus salinarum]
MNIRQEHMLKFLIGEQQPVTGEQLAISIQVTSRTIRNDIKEIERLLVDKDAGAVICSIRGQGYQLNILDDEKFRTFIQTMLEKEELIPSEPGDRVHYLVKRFLLSCHFLKVENLADELFVSRSTLQSDLKEVKDILTHYQLELAKRPNYGLRVVGEEKHIRYAIAEFLFRKSPNFRSDLYFTECLLPVRQMELIQQIVLRQLKIEEFNLSDVSLNNLVVHIAIVCRRINSEQYIQIVNQDEIDIRVQKEYHVAKKILAKIEEVLGLTFPTVEITYVAMHLLGTKLFINTTTKNIKTNFDKDIFLTAEKMVNRVEETMQLGIINDQELIVAIAMHLKPAIYRYKNNMNVNNPMLESIKVNYPLAFEAGVIASYAIEENFNLAVDENEIGYIALHFGAAMERVKLQARAKRCLIVCTTGLGSSQLLLYKLRAKYGSQLKIIGTTQLHSLPQYNKDEIDFIISTVPLNDLIDIPHVVIDTLLDDSELKKIDKKIFTAKKSVVDYYLEKDLIYLNLDLSTPDEVITFLGNEVIEKEYAEKDIINSVLEREKAASTSYGNLVAVPHPLESMSDRTFWTLAILKRPIDWGGNQVQFVCLLHVSDKNKEDLEPMYNYLFQLVDDKRMIQSILTATDTWSVLNMLKRM